MNAFVLLALAAVVACAAPDPTTPSPRPPNVPSRINLLDLAKPEAPSDLAATVIDRHAHRITLAVSWTDNSAFADEYVTCFTFAPVELGAGGGCGYASEAAALTNDPGYGFGVGRRTATVIIARGTWQMTGAVARWVDIGDGTRFSVWGPSSTPVTVVAR